MSKIDRPDPQHTTETVLRVLAYVVFVLGAVGTSLAARVEADFGGPTWSWAVFLTYALATAAGGFALLGLAGLLRNSMWTVQEVARMSTPPVTTAPPVRNGSAVSPVSKWLEDDKTPPSS